MTSSTGNAETSGRLKMSSTRSEELATSHGRLRILLVFYRSSFLQGSVLTLVDGGKMVFRFSSLHRCFKSSLFFWCCMIKKGGGHGRGLCFLIFILFWAREWVDAVGRLLTLCLVSGGRASSSFFVRFEGSFTQDSGLLGAVVVWSVGGGCDKWLIVFFSSFF